MVLIKVAVVGGVGVGKTSLLQQFVAGHFSEVYSETTGRKIYFPSAFINERVYELFLTDLPPVTGFPADSLEEWQLYPGYGLRNADALILVFDLSQPESFQVVVNLHNQLATLKPEIPFVVVGTKLDLVPIQCHGQDISHLIKKQWKIPYIESSAKYNWKVTAVFEELVNVIDSSLAFDQNSKGKNKSNSSGRTDGTKRSRRSQSAQPSSRHCIVQ